MRNDYGRLFTLPRAHNDLPSDNLELVAEYPDGVVRYFESGDLLDFKTNAKFLNLAYEESKGFKVQLYKITEEPKEKSSTSLSRGASFCFCEVIPKLGNSLRRLKINSKEDLTYLLFVMVKEVSRLHSLGISHGGLVRNSFRFNLGFSSLEVRLVNFYSSCWLGKSHSEKSSCTAAQKPHHWAPERCQQQRIVKSAEDVYSLGALFKKLIRKYMQSSRQEPFKSVEEWADMAMAENASDRPSLFEVLELLSSKAHVPTSTRPTFLLSRNNKAAAPDFKADDNPSFHFRMGG